MGLTIALVFTKSRCSHANKRLEQYEGKASGIGIAALQSMDTLKASALESDFFSRWSGHYSKAATARQELEANNQMLGVLPVLLSSLTSMLILVVGGWRVMNGNLSIGMLIAFQSLMQSFQEPVNTLVSFGSTLQELEGDLNRLDDVLDNTLDLEVERETRIDRDEDVSQRIEVQNSKLIENSSTIKQNLKGYIEPIWDLVPNFQV